MENKIGNVKIHTCIAGFVKKNSREIRENLKKVFGGLNKVSCLRKAFEAFKLSVSKTKLRS